MVDLQLEEAMDRLYERMEIAVKRKVLKAARNYVLVSFSNVSTSPRLLQPLAERIMFSHRVTFWMTRIQ
jgi:hypothetical protein